MINGSETFRSAKQELKQFKALLKHFVVRLLNNDVLKYDDQRQEGLYLLLAILTMAGLALSSLILFPYLRAMPGYSHETVWIERTLFMAFSMALTGIIAVINWENIFLDNRDYDTLFVLPVKKTTIFAAKCASLLLFVGIITAAFNFFPVFVFSFFLGHIPQQYNFMPINLPKFILAHLASAFMANLFTFLLVTGIQSLLMLLLRGTLYRKISMFFQTVLIFGFISIFVWFPKVHPSLETLKEQYSTFIYYFPPIWFVGLYEHLVGNFDFVFKQHLYLAAISLTLLVNVYVLSFPLNFKKFALRSTGKKKAAPSRLAILYRKLLHATLLKNPVEKAIYHFSLNTLKRNRKHKLLLAIYIALPTAFILTELVLLYFKKGVQYFQTPGMLLAAIPLIFYMALVAGLRAAVSQPVSLEANWLFRLNENPDLKHYVRGMKKALVTSTILPSFILFFIFYVTCWDYQYALYHSLYCLGIAYLLLELGFMNYHKIPFAAAHVPGKANMKAYWFLYFSAFIFYVYALTGLGLYLLSNPAEYVIFYAFLVSGIAAARWLRYKNYKTLRLVFEEEPEAYMLSLGFDAQ